MRPGHPMRVRGPGRYVKKGNGKKKNPISHTG
jgi:hypothetical protein